MSVIPGAEATSRRKLLQQRIPPRWGVFSAAVLSLLVGSFWLRATSPRRDQPLQSAVRAASVAVLPFVNTSPDVAEDYLGYGLAAELTQALNEVSGLQVSPRTSAFAPRQIRGDPRIAGRRMGVATVLLGSVRRSDDRIRITARLVDVEEGFDVWSEAYEREARELFDIENEIRDAVARALRIQIPTDSTAHPSPPASSFQAYDAYLAGRYELDRLSPGSNRRAIAHLTHAVRLDSTFARAHAALGEAYMRRGGVDAVSPLIAGPMAKAAVARALELDSTLAEAHTTLGYIRFVFDRDWRGAETQFRRALALKPGLPEVYPPYARFLLAMGRIDDSRALSERALQLGPLSPELTRHLGWHYLHARQYDRARETLQHAIALDSAAWLPHFDLALLEMATGNHAAAESHLRVPLESFSHRSEVQAAQGQLHAVSGRNDEAEAVLQQLQSAGNDRYVSPYLLATVQAAVGQRTAAFASLNRAVKERSELVAYLRIDLRVDTLRTDRRFPRLLRQLRLP
ncbi:MAG TPA: tetratricopeptide repeat protein [Gemmatimonadales bacterium]|nr:tetratricopeptide repeat protein [Gemmatimonadales bacterium]